MKEYEVYDSQGRKERKNIIISTIQRRLQM